MDTSTSAVRNHHGRNSLRTSHMRTAPVVGYGRPKDHPRVTVFTRSLGNGINRGHKTKHGWLATTIVRSGSVQQSLETPPRSTARIYPDHRGLLGVALLLNALEIALMSGEGPRGGSAMVHFPDCRIRTRLQFWTCGQQLDWGSSWLRWGAREVRQRK